MRATNTAFRGGIERRLEFIEFRLFWEGHVNRGDLMNAFGISVNQASADLNRYLGVASDNMVYDKSARTYIRGAHFKPLFLKPEAASYLSQLRSISDGIIAQEETWIGQLPTFDTVPTPVRGIDTDHLRAVVHAIRNTQAIEIEYQSLSSSTPRWRWIAPHAIAFDGFRWHTRAYCFTDYSFKDFLLARILGIRNIRPSEVDAGRRPTSWAICRTSCSPEVKDWLLQEIWQAAASHDVAAAFDELLALYEARYPKACSRIARVF